MLKNKIVLITGAGRGIGRAIAIALAMEGAEVVINYNGSEERAKEVKQTIEENGGKASIYKCNVSDFAACEAMIKDIVKEYGHLDILVNNAGITKDGLIMKMKEEDFDSVLNVNLKGTFNTIRHSARQMLKQRSGKIINISSVSGILGNVGQANYAASKAAGRISAFLPSFLIYSAVSSSPFSLISEIATSAPASANAHALALPIPCAAPVTHAFFPITLSLSILSLLKLCFNIFNSLFCNP